MHTDAQENKRNPFQNTKKVQKTTNLGHTYPKSQEYVQISQKLILVCF